jgi:hypothetical protein
MRFLIPTRVAEGRVATEFLCGSARIGADWGVKMQKETLLRRIAVLGGAVRIPSADPQM